MREDQKPGDLRVRLGFAQTGHGQTRPHLSIEDQTSGLGIEIEITPEQLADMLSGKAAEVAADKVTGFKGIPNWGKYLKVSTKHVYAEVSDYKPGTDVRNLPHVSKAIWELWNEGYEVETPRRNNGGQWVIVGRRYDEHP